MPDRVILHMGLHKTGTSALQAAFRRNAHILAQNGICFPQTGEGEGNHDIPAALMAGDKAPLRILVRKTAGAETVFLSSELFSCLTRRECEMLRRLFPGASLELVVVLRRLQDLWPSHWRELIKHGYSNTLQTYLTEVAVPTDPSLSTPVRPFKMLRDREDVFGRESLNLLVYDVRDHHTSYGAEFAKDVLQVSNPERVQTLRTNLTPPPWKVEICRLFNLFGRDWISHIGRKAILREFMNKPDYEHAGWVRDFRDMIERSAPMTLNESTRILSNEHERIVTQYRDRFIDPPEALLAPYESRTRCVTPDEMPSELLRLVRYEFRRIRERLSLGVVS